MTIFSDQSGLTPQQQAYFSISNELIDELLGSDIVVIGSPMHNFTVSWELKAWIDQVVRLGRTIQYGSQGPKGLVHDKKVIVVTTRGGSYGPGTPRFESDFQEPYLRRILAFIGITDITFVHVENQLRREQAQTSQAEALKEIGRAHV